MVTKTRSKTKMLVQQTRSGPKMKKKITDSISFKKTRSSEVKCPGTEVPEGIK